MPRFLLDLEVESHSTLVFPETAIRAVSKDGHGIDVVVSRAKITPATGMAVLSMQVTLSAESILEARHQGIVVVKDVLRAWSFTTSAPFRITFFRHVVDWTPGLKERDCIHLSRHPSDERPHAVLNSETLLSAVRLTNAKLSPALRRAIRWFANGVESDFVDDQFYYFWLAIELVAVETKPPDLVPDACPKCRGPLYCRACDIHPAHRPYPKQAIQALFRRHVSARADDFFRHADKFRNALLHGEDIDVVEREIAVKFDEIVNALGRLAWAALLSTVMNRLAELGESGELPMLKTNQFVNYEMSLGLNLVVTSRDPENPNLCDLPGIDVSLQSKPEKP